MGDARSPLAFLFHQGKTMKKLLSILLFSSLSLLASDNFNESRKELVELYDSLGSAYQYDFYCNAPFKANKKGKYTKFEVVKSDLYTPRNEYTKKVKSIKEQNA